MNALRFRTSIVFGEPKLYPMPEIAKQWQELTGCKTASPSKLKAMRELGFKVYVDEGTFLIKEMR